MIALKNLSDKEVKNPINCHIVSTIIIMWEKNNY